MYQIANLTGEEYDVLIEKLTEIRHPKVMRCGCGRDCCCRKVVYIPCGLNHYPYYKPIYPVYPYPPTITYTSGGSGGDGGGGNGV